MSLIHMYEKDIVRLREMLLRQRQEIFERFRRLESDWQALQERDIELEEEAQKADLTGTFNQLDEFGKQEIEEIDLALYKMADGKYGICENCQKSISLERLEALPATRLCRECAYEYEEKQEKLPRAREVISPEKVPSEYRNLSDKELEMVILEHLRDDSRLDLEELEIFCRKGVVYLEGSVPSESEHQILLKTLTDIMGFGAIIDHLQINELIWEREDRAPGKDTNALGKDECSVYNEEEITDDVFESLKEEIPYIFPDRPPPEEE